MSPVGKVMPDGSRSEAEDRSLKKIASCEPRGRTAWVAASENVNRSEARAEEKSLESATEEKVIVSDRAAGYPVCSLAAPMNRMLSRAVLGDFWVSSARAERMIV